MRYLGFLFLLLLSSCVDNSEDPRLIPDVYVTGVFQNSNRLTAAYWKNGQKFELPEGVGRSYANVIVVSGDDIFIAGVIYGMDNVSMPVLWKNGELISLTKPDSLGINSIAWVTSLVVKDEDVYVGGAIDKNDDDIINTTAVIWKNGQLVELSNAFNKQVNSISISGEDVYVGSNDGYWKNGIFKSLQNVGYLNSTQIVGENIFNVGEVYIPTPYNSVAVFWKNDSTFFLQEADNFDSSRGISIAVSGNDIHVVGYIFDGSKSSTEALIGYWKNGKLIKVLGSPVCQVTSIAVFEKDVYVSGNVYNHDYYNGYSHGLYWLNGKAIVIPDSEIITSIFVKR